MGAASCPNTSAPPAPARPLRSRTVPRTHPRHEQPVPHSSNRETAADRPLPPVPIGRPTAQASSEQPAKPTQPNTTLQVSRPMHLPPFRSCRRTSAPGAAKVSYVQKGTTGPILRQASVFSIFPHPRPLQERPIQTLPVRSNPSRRVLLRPPDTARRPQPRFHSHTNSQQTLPVGCGLEPQRKPTGRHCPPASP